MQKTNKERGPALIGIELKYKKDYVHLMEKMRSHHIDFPRSIRMIKCLAIWCKPIPKSREGL